MEPAKATALTKIVCFHCFHRVNLQCKVDPRQIFDADFPLNTDFMIIGCVREGRKMERIIRISEEKDGRKRKSVLARNEKVANK